jgi:hypothetical protein
LCSTEQVGGPVGLTTPLDRHLGPKLVQVANGGQQSARQQGSEVASASCRREVRDAYELLELSSTDLNRTEPQVNDPERTW